MPNVPTDNRFFMPPDVFPIERVKGVVEEAPAEKVAETPKPVPVARTTSEKIEDCPPLPPPKVKPKAVKRSVFTDSVPEKSKAFSEQIRQAKKRFVPPRIVVPKAVPPKGC